MPELAQLARLSLTLFLSVLFAAVAFQLLTRRIHMRGLLWGKQADGTYSFSPARVQVLIITIGSALYYLAQVLSDPNHLPAVPLPLLETVGVSHAFFLSGKAWQLLLKPLLRK